MSRFGMMLPGGIKRRPNYGGSGLPIEDEMLGRQGGLRAPILPRTGATQQQIPDTAFQPMLPTAPMTRPYSPAPSRAQRREGVRQRSQEKHERVMGFAQARNAMLPGTPANAASGLQQQPMMLPRTGPARNSGAATDTMTVDKQAKAYNDLLADGMGMDKEEARKLAFPTPTAAAPQPAGETPMLPRYSAGTGGTPRREQPFSEQNAKAMYDVMAKQNPNVGTAQVNQMFVQKMRDEYNVDGEGLLKQWMDAPAGQGTYRLEQRGEARPDLAGPPMLPRPQAVIPPDPSRNQGGVAMLPNGNRVAVSPTGQAAPGVISRGAPMKPTPAPVPQGPYSGYTELRSAQPGAARGLPQRPAPPPAAYNPTAGVTAAAPPPNPPQQPYNPTAGVSLPQPQQQVAQAAPAPQPQQQASPDIANAPEGSEAQSRSTGQRYRKVNGQWIPI